MKIAIYHNLTSGGSKRELYEFLRMMKHDNHFLHVYTTEMSDEKFLPTRDYADEVFLYPILLRKELTSRLPGIRKYINTVIGGYNIFKLRQVAKNISGDINNRDYDFVFLHHCRMVQSPFLPRYLKAPSIYYCNEPMREFYEPGVKRPHTSPATFLKRLQMCWYHPTGLLPLYIKYLDRQNIRRATSVITNSNYSAAYIKRVYQIPASVCYLGVDTEKFVPLDCPKKYRVISVGALSPWKGFDFIIEALSCIEPEYRPEFLVVCNTVSLGEKKYLEDLALMKGVVFRIVHNVSDEGLVRLYNESLLFVYAAHREPLGLAVLEAMSCGLPVVAVNEGGVGETVKYGKTGFLVERNSGRFADTLMRLLKDDELRKEFSLNAAGHVRENWRWDTSYKALMDIIGRVLGQK